MKNAELARALDPFERIIDILRPLNVADEKPLRDSLPGIWPTIGDLRRLVDVVKRCEE